MDDELQPWTYLIERRVEARKTRTQLARDAHLSKTYYGQIEKGYRKALPATLGRIADALGIPLLELVRSQPVRQPQRNDRTDTPVAS